MAVPSDAGSGGEPAEQTGERLRRGVPWVRGLALAMAVLGFVTGVGWLLALGFLAPKAEQSRRGGREVAEGADPSAVPERVTAGAERSVGGRGEPGDARVEAGLP